MTAADLMITECITEFLKIQKVFSLSNESCLCDQYFILLMSFYDNTSYPNIQTYEK